MRQTWGAAQTRLLVVVAAAVTAVVALLGGAAPASAGQAGAQAPTTSSTTSSTPYATSQPGSGPARAASAVRTALRSANSSSKPVTAGAAYEVASSAGSPGEPAPGAAPVRVGAPRLLLVQLPRPPDTEAHGAQHSGPTGRAPPAPAET